MFPSWTGLWFNWPSFTWSHLWKAPATMSRDAAGRGISNPTCSERVQGSFPLADHSSSTICIPLANTRSESPTT